ncbi:hypothetical protein ACIP69_00685 [Streptomyces hygroscopicus]|uniref:hypothetical protein n=1 Tax=Streptomyces hygroscopicus TaxID=1912 RepID=UPI0038252CFD
MTYGRCTRGSPPGELLAQKGITGVPDLFAGEYGVLSPYFGGNDDREAIPDGLGSDYQGSRTLCKPWPAVGTAHSHVHATIGRMADHRLVPDDIDEIRVHVGDYHDLMYRPLDARRAPSTLVDAKFSLPFLVAGAAARRTMGAPFRALAARHRRAAGGAAGGNVTRQSPAWSRLTRSARCSRWYARPARRRPG